MQVNTLNLSGHYLVAGQAPPGLLEIYSFFCDALNGAISTGSQ
jgi:hypothetical protein